MLMSTNGAEGPKPLKHPKVPIDRDPSLRAMENPISAIFDLSESVNSQVPRIKKMIQYTGLFVIVWLSVNIVFLIMFLAMANLVLFLLLFMFLVLGSFGLYLMWNINEFFTYFSRRHLAIKLIRDADELVHVPKGRDSVDSYVAYLRKVNPGLDQAILKQPHMLHTPALLTGVSGISYNFDGYIYRPPSFMWRFIGIGDPGYGFYVKCYDHTPGLSEVQALERAVQDVTSKSFLCPSRIVVLVDKKVGALIDDAVYQHITTKKPVIKAGRKKCVVNLQVVSVDEDNTYDFVPVIAEGAQELP
jgi:hypothetical protein